MNQTSDTRSIGLLGATGVGAIVGGGILALAGVAFATTGPGAILGSALNGFIALLTALSFAEMSAAFPESGASTLLPKGCFPYGPLSQSGGWSGSPPSLYRFSTRLVLPPLE